MIAFTHDTPSQRVVFAFGALASVAVEAADLGLKRALVIATPGSGARLGETIHQQLGGLSAGLHAKAVIHVPKPVATAGVTASRAVKADGLIAAGGGSAIGLAKVIALETDLPILAVPTTYSGSEGTPIYGTTDGDRKITGRDNRVVPRTVIYDPDLTLELPADVSAASGMNGIAHCVEALWVAERNPMTMAMATEALHRFGLHLPRVVADGRDKDARAQCLVAAWLAGRVLTSGTALHHKLAHVLGGLGLPHAKTHAIILPHVARFNLAAAPDAKSRMSLALRVDDPAVALEKMVRGFPIPQRLRDIGLDKNKIGFVAGEAAKLAIKHPRPATEREIRALLEAAY